MRHGRAEDVRVTQAAGKRQRGARGTFAHAGGGSRRMTDQDVTARPADLDRTEAADAVGPSEAEAAAAAATRTPEETMEALRACLTANHANTLAYLACLKACVGDPRPYREVEEGLLGAPAFDISSQTPHTLLSFLIQDGGIERIDVAPEGPAQGDVAPEGPSGASAEGEVVPSAQGTPDATDVADVAPAPEPAESAPADASQPIDYLLRTTAEGQAVLTEFDSVARFERLLAAEPEGYLDAYLVVLDTCADDGASLK